MPLIEIRFEKQAPDNLDELLPSSNYIEMAYNAILMWEQDWNEVDSILPLHNTYHFNNSQEGSMYEHKGEQYGTTTEDEDEEEDN